MVDMLRRTATFDEMEGPLDDEPPPIPPIDLNSPDQLLSFGDRPIREDTHEGEEDAEDEEEGEEDEEEGEKEDEEDEEEESLQEEEEEEEGAGLTAEEKRLSKFCLRIGDLVYLTRFYIPVANVLGAPLAFKGKRVEGRKKRYIIMSSGIGNNEVTGVPAIKWIQNSHLGLFRLETTIGSSNLPEGTPKSEKKLEERANKEGHSKSHGDLIKYGQQVQLKHMHSGAFLSLNLLMAAPTPGAWKVVVDNDEKSLCSKVALTPFNRLQSIGDPINYNDSVSIVFQTENLKYFLQSEFVKETRKLDINSTHKPVGWNFMKFQSADTLEDYVRYGVPLKLRYTKLSMEIAVRPKKDKEASKSAREMMAHIIKSENAMQGIGRASLRRGTTEEFLEEIQMEKPDPHSYKVAAVKVIDDYSNFWVLQSPNYLRGGNINWRNVFYIYNPKTEMYIGPDLQLIKQPDPNFICQVMKPDSSSNVSSIPLNLPGIIRCMDYKSFKEPKEGDLKLVLDIDRSTTNEEIFDRLIPAKVRLREGEAVHKEIPVVIDEMKTNSKEVLFQFEAVDPEQATFYMQMSSVYNEFIEVAVQIDNFIQNRSGTVTPQDMRGWQSTEIVEKHLRNMRKCLSKITTQLKNSLTLEIFTERQSIIAGLNIPTVLIHIAVKLSYIFKDKKGKNQLKSMVMHTSIAGNQPLTENLLEKLSQQVFDNTWIFLNDVAMDNVVSCRCMARHQDLLCKMLPYDDRNIGLLLTEIFRLVDPDIKDPKTYFYEWIKRLDTISEDNSRTQNIYMRIIRNLCEIGEIGLVEYQREITNHLFSSDVAFHILNFSTFEGAIAVRFNIKGEDFDPGIFFDLNPKLEPLAHTTADGDTVFLLQELSSAELETYMAYIQSTIMLYTCICRGPFTAAREACELKLGITAELSLIIAMDLNVHIRVREACLYLAEALIVSIPPNEQISSTNQCYHYADIKAQEITSSQTELVVIDYRMHTDEVNKCLKIMFQLWAGPQLPADILKWPSELILRYLKGALFLMSSLIEYNHTSTTYWSLMQKALSYCLAGLSDQAEKYEKMHWVVGFIKEQHDTSINNKDRRLRHFLTEFFTKVILTLISLWKISRKVRILKLLSVCLSNQDAFKYSVLKKLISGTKLPEDVLAKVQGILNTDSTEKELTDMVRKHERSKHVVNSDRGMALVTGLLSSHIRIDPNVYTPDFDLRELALQAPETKDIVIRAILNWTDFSDELKTLVSELMNEMFKDQKLMHKALLSSDVITLGPVSQVYARLKWMKNYSDLPSLIIKSKYETILLGSSLSLGRISSLLEYITNLMHPRIVSNKFCREITQNLVRHMEIHKQFFTLWKLMFYMDKIGKGNDTPVLHCKAALSNFLYFFQLNHRINRTELNKIMRPKHNFTNVIQHATLIQHLNGFTHMRLNEITRMFESVLRQKLPGPHGANSLYFMFTNLVDKDGLPNFEMQNVASTILSETLSKMLPGYKADKTKFAYLLELLAFAAFDNLPVTIECRSLMSYSTISDLMLREDNFLVLYSIMTYLFYSYIYPIQGIKSIDRSAEVLDVVEYIVGKVAVVAEHPEELIQLGIEGAYNRIFLHNNPAHTDVMMNLPNAHTDVAVRWKFFSYAFNSTLKTSALKFIPAVLENMLGLDPLVEYIEQFYKTLTVLNLKILHINKQVECYLKLTPLLNDIETCRKQLRDVVIAKEAKISFPEDSSYDQLLDYYEVTPQEMQALSDALNKKIPLQLRDMSEDTLQQDKELNEAVDTFAAGFNSTITGGIDNTQEFVEAIVKRVDERLAEGVNLTRKEVKEAIPFITLKIIRLQNLFSAPKQRVLFFRIMNGIVPNEELAAVKIYLSPVFMTTHVIERAVDAVLKYESVDEMNCALEFLSKLFLAQSREFMQSILKMLDSQSTAYYLFIKIENEVMETKRQVLNNYKTVAGITITKSTASVRLISAMVHDDSTQFMIISKREQLLINMIKFMQMCCDNCNESFQSYFRTQKGSEGKPDINLLECVSDFLIDIRVAGEFLLKSKGTSEIIAAAMACLIDLVTGPNVRNQKYLGTNVKVYLAMNKLLAETQRAVTEENANIHQACIQFLLSLLEGKPREDIPKTMGKFLDVGLLRVGCETVYEKYVKGNEESFSLELPSIDQAVKEEVEAAMLQAVLLLKLKNTGIVNEELNKFDSTTLEADHYYTFYLKYIGYVELERAAAIEDHYFPIPWRCKYLTPSTKQALITDVSRNSQLKKTEDFLGMIPLCNDEMEHQQFLHRFKRFKSVSMKWSLYGKLAFVCIVIINFILLRTITDLAFTSLKDDAILYIIVTLLGMFQLLFYFAGFFFNQIEYYPNMKLAQVDKEKDVELDEFYKFKDGDAQVMKDIHGMMGSTRSAGYHNIVGERMMRSLGDQVIMYNYIYFLISIIAIYEPVFYPFLLLDIIKQTPELLNILKSITQNYRQLLLTSCLGTIIIYLFSIISFIEFHDYYNPENNLLADTLLNTFFSTLNLGIRSGGGIADVMDLPNATDYWRRMVFDLFFYLIIIIILLNIIFGIIIDTFAELRMIRQMIIDDINGNCYICGKKRSDIDMHGFGWSYHFMCEHSPFAYLAFFMYLKDKKAYDCNGLEKLVKEKLLLRDFTFMPKSSILLEKSAEDKEE